MDGVKALCAMRRSALRETRKQSELKSESSNSEGAGTLDVETLATRALDNGALAKSVKPIEVAPDVSCVSQLQKSELRAPSDGQPELALKLNPLQSVEQKNEAG